MMVFQIFLVFDNLDHFEEYWSVTCKNVPQLSLVFFLWFCFVMMFISWLTYN